MHILVTGATGFIGQYLVKKALDKGHSITALVRSMDKAQSIFDSHKNLNFIENTNLADAVIEQNKFDSVIHLAWDSSKKYLDPQNLFDNVEPQFSFIKHVIEAEITNITISGTCFEYGLQEGKQSEGDHCTPSTFYGLAKRMLHENIMLFLKDYPDVQLKWLRYFYIYGEGQKPRSLFPQLMQAIEDNDAVFNMSSGEQGRDFVHVSTAVHNTLLISESNDLSGIFNIGNGKAVKVIDLVKSICVAKKSNIKLNAGYYPLPTYEPYDFCADTVKMKTVKEIKFDDTIQM